MARFSFMQSGSLFIMFFKYSSDCFSVGKSRGYPSVASMTRFEVTLIVLTLFNNIGLPSTTQKAYSPASGLF